MKNKLQAYQIIELLGTEADMIEAWSDFDRDPGAGEEAEHEVALKLVEALKAELESYFDKRKK